MPWAGFQTTGFIVLLVLCAESSPHSPHARHSRSKTHFSPSRSSHRRTPPHWQKGTAFYLFEHKHSRSTTHKICSRVLILGGGTQVRTWMPMAESSTIGLLALIIERVEFLSALCARFKHWSPCRRIDLRERSSRQDFDSRWRTVDQ
jgi:hypothetical protein